MKISRYNVVIEVEDGIIIYNLNSGGVLFLNEDYKKQYETIKGNSIECINDDLIEALKNGEMIVEPNVNEIDEIIKESRKIRQCNEVTNLTIAPTMACNFVCSYCYEKGVTYETMSEKTVGAVNNFIKQMREQTSKLEIVWYGGEPLLAFDIVKRITKEAIEVFGADNYQASMVTNGYLLDSQVSTELEELKISHIQITLDGPPEIHNKRRRLPNGGDTFNRILGNIKNTIDNNVNVYFTIRINTDKENISNLDEILYFLEKYGLKNKIGIYMAPIHNMGGRCNSPMCFSDKEFAEEEILFIRKSIKEGFNALDLPEKNAGVCGAVSRNCYVINAHGDIFKCLSEITQSGKRIGNVEKPIDSENENLKKWMTYEIDSECYECIYLPVCMGGCPFFRYENNKKRCMSVKENCNRMIELLYECEK